MNDLELLIPTEIIRTNRKSISLIIKNGGDFIVRAPLKATNKQIDKFINEKSSWIITKRKEQKTSTIKPLTFVGEEKINILGKEHIIIYSDISRVKLLENNILVPKQNSKERLISFLKKIAKKHLTERVNVLSQLFGFEYKSISITSAKTCWGSCAFSNNLHFTYKLVICPLDVVDYIVLHELCHTRVKNHSKKFWALVEQCNPYYKSHEKWLKNNRFIVNLI